MSQPAAAGIDAAANVDASSSNTSAAAVPVTTTATDATPRAATTLISGTTINDETGEEEEFTIETIPLAALDAQSTDKLASLASKVLKYFDDEAAEEAAARQ